MMNLTNRRMPVGLTAALMLASWCGVVSGQPPQSAYSLAAGDRVKVTVYGHDDLSGEFEVAGNGGVSLPLIQNVPAAGLTARELEQAITDRLQPGYLKNPRVSVEVLTYRPFFILGEVKAPGSYPYSPGITVLKAAALAGGFTYRANIKRLKITRGGDAESTEIEATLDSEIRPGDVIEVPERFF